MYLSRLIESRSRSIIVRNRIAKIEGLEGVYFTKSKKLDFWNGKIRSPLDKCDYIPSTGVYDQPNQRDIVAFTPQVFKSKEGYR